MPGQGEHAEEVLQKKWEWRQRFTPALEPEELAGFLRRQLRGWEAESLD